MKIGIGGAAYISTPSLLQYAQRTLLSIKSEEHELVHCWWMNKPLPAEWQQVFDSYGHVHENDKNCVSRAWNRSITHLFELGCDYVFVPNLDIILRTGALDTLVRAVRSNPEPILWTMDNWHALDTRQDLPGLEEAPVPDHWTHHPHFSAFMVDRRLFEKVGPFDERFWPAYNEDLDMHWRIRLAGEDAQKYEGARFYHFGSRTIGEDSELNSQNQFAHEALNAYFVEKWGFKPPTADDPFTDGMYRFPFNDPAKAGFERAYAATW